VRGDLLRVCGLVTGVGILNRTSIRRSPHSPRPLFFPSFAACIPRPGSRRRTLCFPCPLDCRNPSSCRLVRDQSLPPSTTPNERPRRRKGPTAGKVSTTDADDPANPCRPAPRTGRSRPFSFSFVRTRICSIITFASCSSTPEARVPEIIKTVDRVHPRRATEPFADQLQLRLTLRHQSHRNPCNR